jgi:hypothetical protein
MWMHTRAHRNRISPAESVQEFEVYDYITDDESEKVDCEEEVAAFNGTVQQYIGHFCTGHLSNCNAFEEWKKGKVESTYKELEYTFNASAWLLKSLNLTITFPKKYWRKCEANKKLELEDQHMPPACMPYTVPTFEEWSCFPPTKVANDKTLEEDLDRYEGEKKAVLRKIKIASIRCQHMYEKEEKLQNDIWASFTKYLLDQGAFDTLVDKVGQLLQTKCLPPGLDPLWVTFQTYFLAV